MDFTKGSGSVTGSIDGIGYMIAASPGQTVNFARGGPGATGILAGDNDGIGVRDDEIGGGEYVTITFDRNVKLTAAYFLDLFKSCDGSSSETAYVLPARPRRRAGCRKASPRPRSMRPEGSATALSS